MIVKKIQLENGTFGPDIPEGLKYKSARLNQDGQTYTITFTPEQRAANRISIAQGRAQLHRDGKLAQVEQYIEQGANVELKIFWKHEPSWDKYSPSVCYLAQHFQIDLDEFWSKAKMIEL